MDKITNKDALNAVKAFTEQSEKNIAFVYWQTLTMETFPPLLKAKRWKS